ncbi:riboflavin synthase alpha chain [Rothia mucilaginosa DY-18]|uniref:Riboflavin synthase alpha chain n=1 Tax=Rothia mucilaginosa (strain DY-18) TaxID=680646 RepID=D2NQM4_ROTMD|nr:hypothetical protein [Rothia mucilaginosa]BAI63950.1 riboflavin synthase alpha chain [Rothia mucilaginosa DY-18]
MAANPTHTDDSINPITPEESLKFAEAGMNLAGHVITDPHLQELLRQLAHHEISFEEYDAATTRHIMGDA